MNIAIRVLTLVAFLLISFIGGQLIYFLNGTDVLDTYLACVATVTLGFVVMKA